MTYDTAIECSCVTNVCIKDSKRDLLAKIKGEVSGIKGIESLSVSSAAMEESSGAGADATEMLTVDGTDGAAAFGVDISLDNIMAMVAEDCTEKFAGGGAEGGTVMLATGESGRAARGGADIRLDGGKVTMAFDGNGRAMGGGGGDIELDKFLNAMLGKASSSIIKSS